MDADSGTGDGPGSGTDAAAGERSPEEAFSRLGSPLRVAILEELHDRMDVGDRSGYTVPYSELRGAVGEADSGRFNYHLDRLVGEFVEKRPGGYVIRPAGREVVRVVQSGVLSGGSDVPAAAVESGPVGAACYRCGAPVTVSYANGYVSACCTECPGGLDFDFTPEGALSSIPVPAGAVGDAVETAPLDLLDRVHGWFCHRSRSFGDGACPRCGGHVDAEFRVCPDHESDARPCRECGTFPPASVRVACQVCDEGGIAPLGSVVGHRGPFRDAHAAAGRDRLDYGTFAAEVSWPVSVTEHDGATALAVGLPDEPEPVVVDRDLSIHAGD